MGGGGRGARRIARKATHPLDESQAEFIFNGQSGNKPRDVSTERSRRHIFKAAVSVVRAPLVLKSWPRKFIPRRWFILSYLGVLYDITAITTHRACSNLTGSRSIAKTR